MSEVWIVYAGLNEVGKVVADSELEALLVAIDEWPELEEDLGVISSKTIEEVRSKLRQRVDRNPAPVAYHEAGHVVVGHHFGREVALATIIPLAFSTPSGHEFHLYSGTLGRVKWKGYRDPVSPQEAEEQILIGLAGPGAEFRRRGRTTWNRVEGSDRTIVEEMMAKFFGGPDARTLRAFRSKTKRLLDSLWPEVETVAAALIEHRGLYDGEVEALLGRKRPLAISR